MNYHTLAALLGYSSGICITLVFLEITRTIINNIVFIFLISIIFHPAGLIVFGFIILKQDLTRFTFYSNFVQAHILGTVFSLGLYFISGIHYWTFGCYVCLVSFFHWSEFFIASIYNPSNLELDLYFMNQSREYQLAVIASCVEYWFERICLPRNYKSLQTLSSLGLFIALLGEFLRKCALLTARENFSHHVQLWRRPGHKLIQHGVYAVFRHPSYVGWFYWCIGTQILLTNPVCSVGYAIASYYFFYERIEVEEQILIGFYPLEYPAYQKKVGTGLPFISGHLVEYTYDHF